MSRRPRLPKRRNRSLPGKPLRRSRKRPRPNRCRRRRRKVRCSIWKALKANSNAVVLGGRVLPASRDDRFRNRPPPYPVEAEVRGEHGAVTLLIHVSESGVASAIDVLESSGYEILDQAAVAAVRKWHFHPAHERRTADPLRHAIPFYFRDPIEEVISWCESIGSRPEAAIKGETSLGDGTRVSKADRRIEAIGAVDEANATIGVCGIHTRNRTVEDAMLARIQNDLFDVGADLCVPGTDGDRLARHRQPPWRAWKPRSGRMNADPAAADELHPARRHRRRRVRPSGPRRRPTRGTDGCRHRSRQSDCPAISQSAVGPSLCSCPRAQRKCRYRRALGPGCEPVVQPPPLTAARARFRILSGYWKIVRAAAFASYAGGRHHCLRARTARSSRWIGAGWRNRRRRRSCFARASSSRLISMAS